MRRPLAVALACLAGIAGVAGLAACSSDDDEAAPAVTIEQADTARTVEVAAGEEFTVEVASNPTTGYTWSYRAAPADAVTEVDSEYVPDEPVLDGSGGTQHWTFTARETARVTFAETPPGETRPARTVTLTVTVTG